MGESKKRYDLIVLGAKGGFLKIVFTKHDFAIRGVHDLYKYASYVGLGNMSGHKVNISAESLV